MSDPALTLLKYVFLAVLYLFFLRVLRAVWVEMREPRLADLPAEAAPPTAPVSVAAPAEKLVVTAPDEMKGREYPLANEVTVGRAAGCGVLLDADSFVSSLHARVFRRDGSVWVEDLGSTNGTFLNGQKVTAPVAVHRGDRVQFGRTTVELRP